MRVGVIFLLGVVLTLVGCGVATDPTRAVPDRWVDPPSVSLAAQTHFTTAQIDAAYAAVTTFAFEHGFDPTLMDPQDEAYAKEQLVAEVVSDMTPAMQERWNQRVDAALSGSADDQDGLRVLQFYSWNQPTWSLPEDGRPVRSQWIRHGEIGATEATEGAPVRLRVNLIHQATVRYLESGEEFELDVAKRVSYWLLPKADDATTWLIDEYEGVFAVGEELPLEDSSQTTLPTPTTTPGVPAAPEPQGLSDVDVEAGQQPLVAPRAPQPRRPVAPAEADAPPGSVARAAAPRTSAVVKERASTPRPQPANRAASAAAPKADRAASAAAPKVDRAASAAAPKADRAASAAAPKVDRAASAAAPKADGEPVEPPRSTESPAASPPEVPAMTRAAKTAEPPATPRAVTRAAKTAEPPATPRSSRERDATGEREPWRKRDASR